MIPPGLAFASVSQKALDFVEAGPGGRYYFDWVKTAKSQRKGNSPFTPAVPLFQGLDVALDMIEEEGLDNVFARHDLLARATRAGIAALGLELYGNPDERSTVVTALELPETIDGNKVPGALRKLGITGGKADLLGAGRCPPPPTDALRQGIGHPRATGSQQRNVRSASWWPRPGDALSAEPYMSRSAACRTRATSRRGWRIHRRRLAACRAGSISPRRSADAC